MIALTLSPSLSLSSTISHLSFLSDATDFSSVARKTSLPSPTLSPSFLLSCTPSCTRVRGRRRKILFLSSFLSSDGSNFSSHGSFSSPLRPLCGSFSPLFLPFFFYFCLLLPLFSCKGKFPSKEEACLLLFPQQKFFSSQGVKDHGNSLVISMCRTATYSLTLNRTRSLREKNSRGVFLFQK